MSTDYQEAALYSLFRVGEYFEEKLRQFISPAYFCFVLSIYTVLYQKAIVVLAHLTPAILHFQL